ncbi:transpeptidase family protein [Bacteroides caecigallinarum]|uniref:penicillin-binding protein n=1 Tax=Bacteroides caecigallinarum TaxID=1411144 RepID=UPI0019589C93|nr:penicillin-binding protein [Bacteroides caecigallinarum]MBM6864754.1 transpeptidase family protein [Bacteroides caecigallinarum]MBU3809362.1 transpeptidase family protein [Candidatus Phocaeicola faecipullorum]
MTLRYTFFVLIMALLAIAVIVKAGIIMFAERQYWKDVADRFVRENVIVFPTRGNIISADGKLMASSLPEFRIYMDFKAGGVKKDTMLMNHLQEICEGLHRIFPDQSAAEFRRTILKGRKLGSRNYLLYPKRISYIEYKEVKKLPVFSLNRYSSGLHELAYNQRKKPFGSLAMRTLGDLYPDTALGAKNGLELTYDKYLKGEVGITHRQKVRNQYLNIVDKAPVDGCDLITTIDVDMQDIAEKALVDQLTNLQAEAGVAIVMEVKTGEVKANVNMTRAGDGKYYEMRNLAVSNLMEPGSTFKTASIMVAMEDGYITPDYEVDTEQGIVNMHGSRMRDWNWYKGGYGVINVTKILEVSSNIGVSRIIDKFYGDNPQKFIDGIKRMSIDTPLNLGFVGEASPKILGPKERYFAKTTLPWMSIGYETQIPPIYILNFYNAIANNGKMVKPKFVKSITKDGNIIKDFPTETINEQICSEHTLEQIQMILKSVVANGLAKPAGSKLFSVSGKTGTAQISQGKAGYKSGGTKHLVSFCGYFPSEKPMYSCYVAIQAPKASPSGGIQAGSVFSKIAERVYAKHLFFDLAQAKDSTSIMIPDTKNGNLKETAYILDELDIKYNKPGNNIEWCKASDESDNVLLSELNINEKLIPNVRGMGAKDAVFLLEERGLRVRLSGMGKVVSQNIPPGSTARKGQTITLTLR